MKLSSFHVHCNFDYHTFSWKFTVIYLIYLHCAQFQQNFTLNKSHFIAAFFCVYRFCDRRNLQIDWPHFFIDSPARPPTGRLHGGTLINFAHLPHFVVKMRQFFLHFPQHRERVKGGGRELPCEHVKFSLR